MATQSISRSIIRRPAKSISAIFARSFSSSSPLTNSRSASSLLHRSRPLVAGFSSRIVSTGIFPPRDLSTQATSSSQNDPNRSLSTRPPNETIMVDCRDFEHWLVAMEAPEGHLSRDEIIDSYIKTLAQVVGSEEEARMKIYSVSHRFYYAFGALVSEDLSLKLKDLPKVRWVLPDAYVDVENKDYGGEPFINGKAVPYHPKYHEERFKMQTTEYVRTKGNRNYKRKRMNFERRRENSRGNQNYIGPPQPPPNMSESYQGPRTTTEHKRWWNAAGALLAQWTSTVVKQLKRS